MEADITWSEDLKFIRIQKYWIILNMQMKVLNYLSRLQKPTQKPINVKTSKMYHIFKLSWKIMIDWLSSYTSDRFPSSDVCVYSYIREYHKWKKKVSFYWITQSKTNLNSQ